MQKRKFKESRVKNYFDITDRKREDKRGYNGLKLNIGQ